MMRRLLLIGGFLVFGWLIVGLQSAHAAEVPPAPAAPAIGDLTDDVRDLVDDVTDLADTGKSSATAEDTHRTGKSHARVVRPGPGRSAAREAAPRPVPARADHSTRPGKASATGTRRDQAVRPPSSSRPESPAQARPPGERSTARSPAGALIDRLGDRSERGRGTGMMDALPGSASWAGERTGRQLAIPVRRLAPDSATPAHRALRRLHPRLRGVLAPVVSAAGQVPPVHGLSPPCPRTTELTGLASRLAPVPECATGALIPDPIERKISDTDPGGAAVSPATATPTGSSGGPIAPPRSPDLRIAVVMGGADPSTGAPMRMDPRIPHPDAETGQVSAEPTARIVRARARTDEPKKPPLPPTAPTCGKEGRGLPKPPPEPVGDLIRTGQTGRGGTLEGTWHVATPALAITAEDPAVSPD
ncbi:hypothetical protein [Actinomadura sp. HBU206391]|uniref:hypothetical protein n=1 Tax=Actinomadura sp. HBU206391 TaxID=2731692 RepID=UPI00164FB9C5|nr:hypothetical protein [Actinomadura sp. HBU206391]MBC6458461.1 hypothetical protein [Actinomadura sp. HBU206391]